MEFRLCLLVLFVGSIKAQSPATLSRLVDNLLSDYNKIVPPALKGVNVSHAITLLRLASFEDQVLTTETFTSNQWSDGRLAWDPAQFDGINQVRIPASKIWIPDIELYNDAGDYASGKDYQVVIANNGQVTYVPKVRYMSTCEYKAKSMKRNRKVTCTLKLGSWVYSAEKLDLYNTAGKIDDSKVVPNQNWKLVDTSVVREEAKYDCCPETYSALNYKLTLKPYS